MSIKSLCIKIIIKKKNVNIIIIFNLKENFNIVDDNDDDQIFFD